MEDFKRRTIDYWTERATDFSRLRMREFEDKKHEQWMQEIRQYLPKKGPLEILDLGTGTGFFCFLLAAEGHRMTGIDLTEKMIKEACVLADCLKIPAEFYVMDAEQPEFEPESFDVLITRNLTWGLPHLKDAYANWYQLLKQGGILINFDADYCRENVSPVLPENHAHKGIAPKLTEEYENMKELLRPMQQPRPEWDIKLLQEAGFTEIRIDTDVWKRIYSDMDEFYNPTPIFTITARK